jgi:hypothetical protein
MQSLAQAIRMLAALLAVSALTLCFGGCDFLNQDEQALAENPVDMALRVNLWSVGGDEATGMPPDNIPTAAELALLVTQCNALKNNVHFSYKLLPTGGTNIIPQDKVKSDLLPSTAPFSSGQIIECRVHVSSMLPNGNFNFIAEISSTPAGNIPVSLANAVPWQKECASLITVQSADFAPNHWIHFTHDIFAQPGAHDGCCRKRQQDQTDGPPPFPPNCA